MYFKGFGVDFPRNTYCSESQDLCLLKICLWQHHLVARSGASWGEPGHSNSGGMMGGKTKKDSEVVLDFLNAKAGKRFRPLKETLKHINNRLKEGFTVEELTKVISYKVEIDAFFKENPQYINPKTLFRPSNFANYLGEVDSYESE